ncbi:hypothetical protein TNCV_2226571 [Trichonephila clavipes]|nr:hypothetical protein TNCV_2226571 [Trichonephila clavipes]
MRSVAKSPRVVEQCNGAENHTRTGTSLEVTRISKSGQRRSTALVKVLEMVDVVGYRPYFESMEDVEFGESLTKP